MRYSGNGGNQMDKPDTDITANSEQEWVVLSGCNACINSHLCKELGNCVLLSLNNRYPVNDKKKRRMVQRMRHWSGTSAQYKETFMSWLNDVPELWPEPEVVPRAWPDDEEGKYKKTKSTVRLTKIEQMFIDAINKPR